jgi:hypothetical protein
VLDLPADPLIAELVEATRDAAPLAKPGKRIWPLWICPLLIRAAPLKDVFWLDCDAVVLRGLDELFAMLEDGPVFTDLGDPVAGARGSRADYPDVESLRRQRAGLSGDPRLGRRSPREAARRAAPGQDSPLERAEESLACLTRSAVRTDRKRCSSMLRWGRNSRA